jgi:hypothetical protein
VEFPTFHNNPYMRLHDLAACRNCHKMKYGHHCFHAAYRAMCIRSVVVLPVKNAALFRMAGFSLRQTFRSVMYKNVNDLQADSTPMSVLNLSGIRIFVLFFTAEYGSQICG